MRLAILILAAVAAFAQEDKFQVEGSGTVLIGSAVEWRSNDAKYLVVDVGQPYAKFALIIRDSSREPTAFCNIKLGRCWDVKWSWERYVLEAAARLGTGTLRVYDSTTHDSTTVVPIRRSGLTLAPGWGQTKLTRYWSGDHTGSAIELGKTGLELEKK